MTSGGERCPAAEEIARRTRLPRPVVLILAHLDPLALGIALGFVMGAAMFAATIILALRGGDVVGPNLSLLSQYFIGYTVTAGGSLVGFVYAALIGFIIGYAFAFTRNFLVHSYLRYIRRRAEQRELSDLLDRLS